MVLIKFKYRVPFFVVAHAYFTNKIKVLYYKL